MAPTCGGAGSGPRASFASCTRDRVAAALLVASHGEGGGAPLSHGRSVYALYLPPRPRLRPGARVADSANTDSAIAVRCYRACSIGDAACAAAALAPRVASQGGDTWTHATRALAALLRIELSRFYLIANPALATDAAEAAADAARAEAGAAEGEVLALLAAEDSVCRGVAAQEMGWARGDAAAAALQPYAPRRLACWYARLAIESARRLLLVRFDRAAAPTVGRAPRAVSPAAGEFICLPLHFVRILLIM